MLGLFFFIVGVLMFACIIWLDNRKRKKVFRFVEATPWPDNQSLLESESWTIKDDEN